MRAPIKLNKAFWPLTLSKALPSAEDPRVLYTHPRNGACFTKAVSVFKFGKTFKSTHKARYPLAVAELASLYKNTKPVILDVGASDGTTSMDVMQSIPFQQYFVTDVNLEVFYQQSNKAAYFYDDTGTCLLIVTDKWVVYPDSDDAVFPFRQMAESLFRNAPQRDDTARPILLIHPLLQDARNQNVIIRKYDVMEPWPYDKVNLVIAANLLNRCYFADERIQQALRNVNGALKDDGRVAIVDNRDRERATIFLFRAGSAVVERRINGGTELEELVLHTFP
jgi:hypothetical protein